jgi:hypothetical protein
MTFRRAAACAAILGAVAIGGATAPVAAQSPGPGTSAPGAPCSEVAGCGQTSNASPCDGPCGQTINESPNIAPEAPSTVVPTFAPLSTVTTGPRIVVPATSSRRSAVRRARRSLWVPVAAIAGTAVLSSAATFAWRRRSSG